MLLQCFDRFNRLAEFAPTSGGAWSELARQPGALPRTAGQYGLIGEVMVLVYRVGESVLLRVGGSVLELDERVSIDLQRSPDHCTISISRDATPFLQWDYKPVGAPGEDDPTVFADAEDFDFALFLANISRDAARRSRLFRVQ
ncbi:MAG: hypothetical protein ABFC96_15675 [Thermoguttaceae bacterium]